MIGAKKRKVTLLIAVRVTAKESNLAAPDPPKQLSPKL
jgi:hypothetical protein